MMSNITNLQDKVKGENKTLYSMITLILEDMAETSINTAKNYEGNYREFFKITLKKEMEFVTWEDLLSIDYERVLVYRRRLRKNNINKTVNAKLSSLNTLYKELHKTNRLVDVVVVDPKRLPEDESDSVSWGSLTEHEVQDLLDYCMTLPAREKPLIKKMFFETAFVTAIRQGALLNMKWKNINKVKVNTDNGEKAVWVIKIKDKGKTIESPITDEFYDKLSDLKYIVHSNGLRNNKDDKVFNVTEKTLSKTLKNYCEFAGIDKERNIVLHSLKKASIDKVYNETKDINKTARHGHHSGVEMVYKHYQGHNETLLDKPSYTIFDGSQKDITPLELLSKEELLELISQCDQNTINIIKSHIK